MHVSTQQATEIKNLKATIATKKLTCPLISMYIPGGITEVVSLELQSLGLTCRKRSCTAMLQLPAPLETFLKKRKTLSLFWLLKNAGNPFVPLDLPTMYPLNCYNCILHYHRQIPLIFMSTLPDN